MSSFIAYFYPVEELKKSMENTSKIISTIENNSMYNNGAKGGYLAESIINIPELNLFSVDYGRIKPLDILTIDGIKRIEQLIVAKSTIFYEDGVVAYFSLNSEDIEITTKNIENLLDINVNPQPLYLSEQQGRKIKDEAEEVRSLQTKKVAGADWASGSGRGFEHARLNDIIDLGELYSFKIKVDRIEGLEDPIIFGVTLTSRVQTPTKFTIFTRNLTPEREAIASYHLLNKIIMPKCKKSKHFQLKLKDEHSKLAENENMEDE